MLGGIPAPTAQELRFQPTYAARHHLQAVMGGVSLAYKCKTPPPRDLLLINIVRALFGLSTGLMIAGGLYASAAQLEHGGSNNVKVPWTFSGFSLALIMFSFASRDVAVR